MKRLTPILLSAVIAAGCSRDIPMVNLGIDDTYYIARMTKLALHPAFTGEKYRWSIDGVPVAEERDYIFLAQKEGSYNVRLEIIDPTTPYDFSFTVNVLHEDVEYSPYISKVYEYCPAPGQFINDMPAYEPGDTYSDILRKVEESISGTNDVMISLGAYGGYVTFGFDHTVVNVPGEYDFRIWGNCFYELLEPEKMGGSCEPGIVEVSYDANCNGIPDDPWYELAGSDYYNHDTRHNYTITYNRPDPYRTPTMSDDGFIDDTEYIPWTDNSGESGYVAKNIFHSQDYYPKWVDSNELTFTGTCLPQNGVDRSGSGRYYVLYAFGWGYVDNHPNEYEELNSFKIDWAVDANGNTVDLPGADFIRVRTGVNQYCGWIGETSTELSRAQDLHIEPAQIIPPVPLE